MLFFKPKNRKRNFKIWSSAHSKARESIWSGYSRAKKTASSGRYIGKTLVNKAGGKEKVEKYVWNVVGMLVVVGMVFTIGFLFWLKKLTNELPDIQNPVGQVSSSKIYDKNGTLLYSVNPQQFSRELIRPNEFIPEALKWSFLAAEDEDFYNHSGVDLTAILRCVVYKILRGPTCGGSTLTQQVVVNTKITREYSYVRKIKDIILALQMERMYSKDEIMNFYLNVVPEGGGNLGVKTGAKLYFGKEIKDLEIPEMIVLAAVVQSPSRISPTIGSDLVANRERLYVRADYILGQMIDNLERINDRIRLVNESHKDTIGYQPQSELTVEQLEKAKEQVRQLEYRKPVVTIKAPHFVWYVRQLLQERAYNNGKVFTASEIETGGLNIYTTLDYSLQEIAEKFVSSADEGNAGWYRNKYQARNSALMTMDPQTGGILTMVGSKCYQDNEYIQNCGQLDIDEGGQFDPDVNVLDTLQSPGSTNKAIAYYLGFHEGIISTASTLPDLPIKSIPNYYPKNWDGNFWGYTDVRTALAKSRNIPALFLVDALGIQKYVDTARQFGYTTYGNADGYGPSIVLGGADVKPIEHAQAFSIFANGGNFVLHEAIAKITDIDGNLIYQHTPEKVSVADPAAIYLVNNVLNPRVSGGLSPVRSITDRDVAGKTGTSESNRDTWFVLWSPEFVSLGWMGNNDNTRMSSQSFGSTSVVPWVENYQKTINAAFPNKTAFSRPGGIVTTSGRCPNGLEECDSPEIGMAVAGKVPPIYLQKKKILVCLDQQDKLAREIDSSAGFAFEKEFTYLQSPSGRLQKDVDAYFATKEGSLPTEQCDIIRNTDPEEPDVTIFSPQPGFSYSGQLPIDVRAFVLEGEITKMTFELGGEKIAQVENEQTLQRAVDIGDIRAGLAVFEITIVTSRGNKATKSFPVFIGNSEKSGSLLLQKSSEQIDINSPVVFSANYDGNKEVEYMELYQVYVPTNVTYFAGDMVRLSSDKYEYSWISPFGSGSYKLYAVAHGPNFTLSSNVLEIQVVGAPAQDNINDVNNQPALD